MQVGKGNCVDTDRKEPPNCSIFASIGKFNCEDLCGHYTGCQAVLWNSENECKM